MGNLTAQQRQARLKKKVNILMAVAVIHTVVIVTAMLYHCNIL